MVTMDQLEWDKTCIPMDCRTVFLHQSLLFPLFIDPQGNYVFCSIYLLPRCSLEGVVYEVKPYRIRFTLQTTTSSPMNSIWNKKKFQKWVDFYPYFPPTEAFNFGMRFDVWSLYFQSLSLSLFLSLSLSLSLSLPPSFLPS